MGGAAATPTGVSGAQDTNLGTANSKFEISAGKDDGNRELCLGVYCTGAQMRE